MVEPTKYGRYEIRQLLSLGRKLSVRFGLANLPPRGTRLLSSCPFETTLPLAGNTLDYSAARVFTPLQQQYNLQQQQHGVPLQLRTLLKTLFRDFW